MNELLKRLHDFKLGMTELKAKELEETVKALMIEYAKSLLPLQGELDLDESCFTAGDEPSYCYNTGVEATLKYILYKIQLNELPIESNLNK